MLPVPQQGGPGGPRLAAGSGQTAIGAGGVPQTLCHVPGVGLVSGIEMEIVNSCEANNGGCSHGCSHGSSGPLCTCPRGYELDEDQKTCIGALAPPRCPRPDQGRAAARAPLPRARGASRGGLLQSLGVASKRCPVEGPLPTGRPCLHDGLPPPSGPHSRGWPCAMTSVLGASVRVWDQERCGCLWVRALAGVGVCPPVHPSASRRCVCPQMLTTVPTPRAASRSAPTALAATSAAATPATGSAPTAAGVRVSGHPEEGHGVGLRSAWASAVRACSRLPDRGHWSHGVGPHPWLLPAQLPLGRVPTVTEQGDGGMAVAGSPPSWHSLWASGGWAARGGRGHPCPWPLEDRPSSPVCPQTWTSACPAVAAVTTAAPTWLAPSSAPVRPASGWTMTAEAAPVSLRQSPRGPLLGRCTLPSWHPRSRLWDRPGATGGRGG